MSISRTQERLLTSGYWILNRSGLLGTALGQNIFRSAYFLYKRYIEDDLQALLRAHAGLLAGGNVLDVGANVGYTAALFARAIDAGRFVYAFEPEPRNFRMLERLAASPDFRDSIIPIQSAVGAEDGMVELWRNERHHADHRILTNVFRPSGSETDVVKVPLVSIDSFVARNPGPISFVKIDVQGYEFPVCKGMDKTIEENPEITVVLEYMPEAMRELGFEPADLIRWLDGRGFRTYYIQPKGRLAAVLPSHVEKSGYVDLMFSRCRIKCGGDS
jgi:FkbM family methyltransferase